MAVVPRQLEQEAATNMHSVQQQPGVRKHNEGTIHVQAQRARVAAELAASPAVREREARESKQISRIMRL